VNRPDRRTRHSGGVRGLPGEVKVLAAVAFCVAAGFGIVAPVIPVFARTFGVSRTAAGAVVSAFALMRLLSVLRVGRLVDRLGSRRVLGVGIAVVAVSSALAGLAQTYTQLIVLRGVGGIGSAMFSVSASALLLGVTTPETRGRSLGAFQGGFLAGGVAGPALGGVVSGISVRAPFFFYAGTLAAAGAVGLALLPRVAGSPRGAGDGPGGPTLREALRLPAFRAACVTNAADSWAVLGVRSALVPLFVAEALHRSTVVTGLGFVVFTAGNVVTLVLGGRVVDRRGRRPVLLAGCSASAGGVALLALPASLPLFLVSLVVFGLGSGLLDTAPAAMMGDVAQRSGTVVAAFQMAGDAGSLAGPLVAGALADGVGYGAAFGATAGVLALAAVVASRAPETLRRSTVGV